MDASQGARAEVVRTVTAEDTAPALGSGSLAVLATPRLLAWCEAATCRAVEGRLPVGSTTVGTSVRLEHLAPSAPGETITVRAELTEADGRRLTFVVEAADTAGTVVGRGTVERVVVDEERFRSRLRRPRGA